MKELISVYAKYQGMNTQPVTVICSFRVKSQAVSEFEDLLAKHWPALRSLGLASEVPPLHFRGDDGGRGPLFVHIFEWCDEQASRTAHDTPEVMAIWEPMGACVEARGDLPAMDFQHFARLEL